MGRAFLLDLFGNCFFSLYQYLFVCFVADIFKFGCYEGSTFKRAHTVGKGILIGLGVIIVISILVQRSPVKLITGLGAFAAVLMLVFKDSILGFVAGVQLAQNDIVRKGDWIVMPGGMLNGVVIDITLNTVKVQNFDNTIVTVPPYSLISGTLQNWRGMAESGGRRIMRDFYDRCDIYQSLYSGVIGVFKERRFLKIVY